MHILTTLGECHYFDPCPILSDLDLPGFAKSLMLHCQYYPSSFSQAFAGVVSPAAPGALGTAASGVP